VIEKWHVEGATVGTRVLGELSTGVKHAIEALGRGFLAHPANDALRTALASGTLAPQEYYRCLLRLVYRLLFLFVTESRDLLLDPAAPRRARDLYQAHYSAARLQALAATTRGNRHRDLYESLKLVMTALGGPGSPPLGLIGLGGYLWSDAALGLLGSSALSNAALLAAVRSLSTIVDKDGRRSVDYKNLGSEELGGVYEQLLELHPEINPTAPLAADRFHLGLSAGNERKTSGSHYTPDSLVQVCLDTALEPLLAERLAGKRGPDAEHALLTLKVCDTAVGSGHFLIGAAHRLAKRLAAVRTGDAEPSPEAYRTALRDCIRNCLYGVDLNPMAAELCRVALWLESMEPGKPLSFLDHHIKIGNSLLGATPALLAKGIPDEAFDAIEGDDKKLCTRFKKANKKERPLQEGQQERTRRRQEQTSHPLRPSDQARQPDNRLRGPVSPARRLARPGGRQGRPLRIARLVQRLQVWAAARRRLVRRLRLEENARVRLPDHRGSLPRYRTKPALHRPLDARRDHPPRQAIQVLPLAPRVPRRFWCGCGRAAAGSDHAGVVAAGGPRQGHE